MANRKVSVMHVWDHNSPLVTYMLIKTRKETSIELECLFIGLIIFEVCTRKRKEERKIKKEERTTKSNFMFGFLSLCMGYQNISKKFYNEITKVFSLCFISLRYGYLRAVPIL